MKEDNTVKVVRGCQEEGFRFLLGSLGPAPLDNIQAKTWMRQRLRHMDDKRKNFPGRINSKLQNHAPCPCPYL